MISLNYSTATHVKEELFSLEVGIARSFIIVEFFLLACCFSLLGKHGFQQESLLVREYVMKNLGWVIP